MPPPTRRPPELAWQVFRGSDAVRRGLLTVHQLRGAGWVRLRRDIYADSRLARTHALACRGAALQLPPGAVIAGPSAAYLHGVGHAVTFDDEVHVLAPAGSGLRTQRGLRVHSAPHRPSPSTGPGRGSIAPTPTRPPGRPGPPVGAPAGPPVGAPAGLMSGPPGGVPGRETWPAGDPPPHPPIPHSRPAQAAWETAVWWEPALAVGVVDALLARGLTTVEALRAVADRHADRPGGRRARWVFDLADPAAGAPDESHLRVRLMLAGLPRPVARPPVLLPCGLVVHPDLAWPELRVAVECDGLRPPDPERSYPAPGRAHRLTEAGWLVLHVTGPRLAGGFPTLVREINVLLAARGWRR